jgi:repressor of nif and glnA expression
MKEISISSLLKNMSDENNYSDDIWKSCLDKKGKRYQRKDITHSLKKLEILGFIKKNKISSTDVYYNKIQYSNPDDYLGFINNIIFENESKIKESLKKLEDKKIFVDISKDLISYKLKKISKIHYEQLLDAFSNLTELASSILLVKETSNNEKLKNQLTLCHDEIKETLEKANDKIIAERKSTERIVIERRFAGRIPSAGCLKL